VRQRRDFAGLPDSNAGTHLEICVVDNTNAVENVKPAGELGSSRWEPGRANYGGLVEYVIPGGTEKLSDCKEETETPVF
jgi:hypothetical protein